MKFLVITHSKILNDFFKLVISSDTEFVKSAKDAKSNNYVAIFIDDIVNVKEELDYIQNNLTYHYLILIGSGDKEDFDFILNKPFLPKDLENLIKSLEMVKDIDIIENIEELANELTTPSSTQIKTNILDPVEVAKIKELIMQDEESTNYLELVKKRESIKLKNKKAKKFLKDFCKLPLKERKAILKKAKVLIKIDFKENNE